MVHVKYIKVIILKSENNKFKISAPTWNEEFELLDGSYSASDIQDYFEYILKKTRYSYLYSFNNDTRK